MKRKLSEEEVEQSNKEYQKHINNKLCSECGCGVMYPIEGTQYIKCRVCGFSRKSLEFFVQRKEHDNK